MNQSSRIVASLIAGLIVGVAIHALGNPAVSGAAGLLVLVGELWLKLLQMTVLPLLVSLLVTGIVAAKDVAASGRLAGRSLLLFGVFLAGSTALAASLTPALLSMWPVDPEASAALRAGMTAAATDTPAVPPLGEWLANIVPTNPFQAAADGALLPLIVFMLFFSLAAARLEASRRAALLGFFEAAADAMLIVVRWILGLAVVGVFALALGVGMRGGFAAAGAIAHYLILMCGLAMLVIGLMYPLAVAAAGVPLGRFARAVAPAQAVAFSTQSSLASLPAMLQASQEGLRVPARIAGVVLPLAVSLFKVTSPCLNLSIVLFVAHVSGMELGVTQIMLGMAVAMLTSFGVAGIPGQASFLTTSVPIAAAMGVPMQMLLLLIAVEVIPDIFRTVGNVTADLVVTAIVARHEPAQADSPPVEDAGG